MLNTRICCPSKFPPNLLKLHVELDRTAFEPVAFTPGRRGRKKKVLQARKDDREITSFFRKPVKPSGVTCFMASYFTWLSS